MELRADSLASTHAIAAVVAALARPGDVIVLAGEMGAGKTAFAQGFGRALGITEAITSPTFTLVHSYPIPGSKWTLHHADLYRLDSTTDVDDLALHELAEFDGIVLVEWGDVAAAALGDHLEIRLRPEDWDDLDDADDVDADTVAGPGGDADVQGERVPVAGPDEDAAVLADAIDGVRLVEVEANGATWAGRWDRLRRDLEAYRC